jgi:hypothetical protein
MSLRPVLSPDGCMLTVRIPMPVPKPRRRKVIVPPPDGV